MSFALNVTIKRAIVSRRSFFPRDFTRDYFGTKFFNVKRRHERRRPRKETIDRRSLESRVAGGLEVSGT